MICTTPLFSDVFKTRLFNIYGRYVGNTVVPKLMLYHIPNQTILITSNTNTLFIISIPNDGAGMYE